MNYENEHNRHCSHTDRFVRHQKKFLVVNLALFCTHVIAVQTYKHNMRVLSGNIKYICSRHEIGDFLHVSTARTSTFCICKHCTNIVFV
jgi:hypothetical protein